MKLSAARTHAVTSIISSDFERFASDLTMSVWNYLAHLPTFHQLRPQDYPELYDTVHRALKHYRVQPK